MDQDQLPSLNGPGPATFTYVLRQLYQRKLHIFLFHDPHCKEYFALFNELIQFEDAAKEVADEVTRPRPEGEEGVEDIQIMINSSAVSSTVRQLKV